jgi:hypothetical protein
VSPSQLALIEHEREVLRSRLRIRRYHADSETLFITIPNILHEELHSRLYQLFTLQLGVHGLGLSWRTFAHSRLPSHQGHAGGGGGGEGDSAGGPEVGRGGCDDWPTLVIEAGDSESLRHLRADMEWWFATSNHQVKIVILAKFDHARRTIVLEKWEEEAAQSRAGATNTRHSSTLVPVQKQHITITHDQTTIPATYNVTRGALVLEFRLLFLRNPGPGESDIVISVPLLVWYAAGVFTRVDQSGR